MVHAFSPLTSNVFAQLAFPQAQLLQAASQIPPFALPGLLNAYSSAALAPLAGAFVPPFLSMPPPSAVQAQMAPLAGFGYAPQKQQVDFAPMAPNNFISRMFNPERREAARMEKVLREDPFARQAFEQAIGGKIVDFGSKNDGRFTVERNVPVFTPQGTGAAVNPMAAQIGALFNQMDPARIALAGLGGGALGALAGSALGNPFLGLTLGGLTGIASQLIGGGGGLGGPGGFASLQGGVQGFPLFGMGSASWNPLAQPGLINGSNRFREGAHTAQVHSVLSDPSLTMEDKIMLAMMLICQKMDDDIKRQTEYLSNLQNQQGNRNGKAGGLGLLGGVAGGIFGGPIGAKVGSGVGGMLGSGGAQGQDGEKSIDIETKKLERMITKRATLFDTLGKIMERYDQSAKSVIQSMRG